MERLLLKFIFYIQFVIFGVPCHQVDNALDNLDTVYTNNFTFKIKENNEFNNAKSVIHDEGFNFLYHIVSNFYLFNKLDIQLYSVEPFDLLKVQRYQRKLDPYVESIVQSSERRISSRQYGRRPGDLRIQQTHHPFRPPRKFKDDLIGHWDPGGHFKVIVGVVDVQFDLNHENYKDNVVHDLCYDFIYNTRYKGITDGCYSSLPPKFSHGTQCMGRIAANGLYHCDAGVNPQCSLAALRVISNTLHLSDERLARALVYKLDDIHIYSCSYGMRDNYGFEPLGEVTAAALKEGVERGRGCKGRIYVFPSGNGHIDNCNGDGYANSVDTITIANIDRQGHLPPNKEVCPCALVAVEGDGYITTNVCERCSSGFNGSSASTAAGAGYISLLLSANENLSKRDVEHLLVRSASKELVDQTVIWHKNWAGFEFNEQIGFGVPNRERMVDLARIWKSVPERHTCMVKHNGPVKINTLIVMQNPLIVSFQSDRCRNTNQSVQHLEHVQLKIHIKCPHLTRLQIYLKSPSGTISPLLTKINYTKTVTKLYTDFHWTFMSVNFWGEDPGGIWNVVYRMKYNIIKGTCTVMSQTLFLYGTSVHPETGAIPLQCIKKDKEDDDKSLYGWQIALIISLSCLFVILTAVGGIIYIFCFRQKSGSYRCHNSVSYVRKLESVKVWYSTNSIEIFDRFDTEVPFLDDGYFMNPSSRDGYTDSTRCLIIPEPKDDK